MPRDKKDSMGGRGRGDQTPTWVKAIGAIGSLIRPESLKRGGKVRKNGRAKKRD